MKILSELVPCLLSFRSRYKQCDLNLKSEIQLKTSKVWSCYYVQSSARSKHQFRRWERKLKCNKLIWISGFSRWKPILLSLLKRNVSFFCLHLWLLRRSWHLSICEIIAWLFYAHCRYVSWLQKQNYTIVEFQETHSYVYQVYCNRKNEIISIRIHTDL